MLNDNILGYELPTLTNYFDADYSVTHKLINALFNRFSLNLGPTSQPYWIDQYTDNKQANRMLLKLVKDGVISTTVVHNYAQIQMNREFLLKSYTQSELTELITKSKVTKYAPLLSETVKTRPVATDVKMISGIKESGLARFGFAEAGNHKFKYDTEMMLKYRKEIIKFSIKSMEKMEVKLKRSLRLEEGYDYQSVIEKVIDLIIKNQDEEYILGSLVLDFRGRAIYECLKTIFNPLGNKMARALVIAPEESVTNKSKANAYLCISELVYGFDGNIERKTRKGFGAYNKREFHELDLDTEYGIDNLFENIWLERLYNELDQLKLNPKHKVTTPLEVDFGASNITIIGLLLGHQRYVDHTEYMWDIEGLSKLHVKFAQTPYVFGSTASPKTLWKKNKLDYTDEQVRIIRKAQVVGKFSIANRLKDIIINEANPLPTMELVVDRERFTVECNKTKNVAETTKQYIVIDSKTQSFKVIHHTDTHRVPDLKQFKRSFISTIIHNKDGQILDNICLGMKWILPNHDAGIVTWSGASDMRKLAVREMEETRANGDEILFNYLKSINLSTKGWRQYAKLKADIRELNQSDKFNISPYLLK